MEQRVPRNITCILSSPAGQWGRGDPRSSVYPLINGRSSRVALTGTSLRVNRTPRLLIKPPSAITPPPPRICPACIHYSPRSLHRQHSHDC
ncbi:hypothetical protein PBY51_016957 [Eleginops maclovinus]|uniref:Uncharacterized protein n=1 Tax=Eleginops maclovinus TaxID=56733 RepID=A0AAN7WN17_ELEMC|nr:hypothetical protein PBY51_016957 [Eleginops maclovinus]